MTLHPIAVVEQVIEEYRSHVLAEFRARDPELRAALEEALGEPRFLAQEPFFQSHRPFKTGARWEALGLTRALARAAAARADSETAYLHQSEAITHLLGPTASSLVVTTGTGSGKTECFLLPAIQNAIDDAARHGGSALTALLLYPMNALANDQEERIADYLKRSGHSEVRVARYDRSTGEAERAALRARPPHLLLTNYMMLEYLLVRPADREALFCGHRCRFLVLDEVHTYRGNLGTNIALLVRRLKAHLARAADPQRPPPPLLTVATSATIKSLDEAAGQALDPSTLRLQRDQAVRQFLTRLTGEPAAGFRVLGEELVEIAVPPEAGWPKAPEVSPVAPDPNDAAAVHRTLAALAGVPDTLPLDQVVRRAGILWKLGALLAARPLSLGQITQGIAAEVPERREVAQAVLQDEVRAALVAGAALPESLPGALRLRTHQMVRGGWRFFRCIDPACGGLYPGGEAECGRCGLPTAPLYLCRHCGADTLRFRADDPEVDGLVPYDGRENDQEWLRYDIDRLRLSPEDADETDEGSERQMRGRLVQSGSFDPRTQHFSRDSGALPLRVVLAPARNTCLVCGGSAGPRSVMTPVSLGTSAAVRVLGEGLVEALGEAHARAPKDGGAKDRAPKDKERLLIFADSRQDAAHQARYISFSGRYDRMRRRLLRMLGDAGGALPLERAIHALFVRAVEVGDNPATERYRDAEFMPEVAKSRARAWEEAPLLDDLAVTAGYRATVLNLGLVGVRYERLDALLAKQGTTLAASLGLTTPQLTHIARCLLDEIRQRRALSRPLLQFHPASPSFPDELRSADWERRVKTPSGYPWVAEGQKVVAHLEAGRIPEGVTLNNLWRRRGVGGRSPSLERKWKHLVRAMRGGREEPGDAELLELLGLLVPMFLVPVRLQGFRQGIELLQVNADSVVLGLVDAAARFQCSVCNVRLPWATEGAPCPACRGVMRPWVMDGQNRYVRRLEKTDVPALVAGEHTAQVTGARRLELEADFKGNAPLNVLACSPTLEMGIDVGTLDAVILRNVPPRPDNYAQRSGRAGRRSRIGIVFGYARATPHDGYFYDQPAEMIAGEVPAPPLSLGNRDVIVRHLTAIAMGLAEPGLKGRMIEYLTLRGERNEAAIEALIAALEAEFPAAVELGLAAWSEDILAPAGLDGRAALLGALNAQPARIRDLFVRVQRQVIELQRAIDQWRELGRGDRGAIHSMDLVRRLLGLPREAGDRTEGEADDRGAGHPMRRLAEFGILPGYEFPSEPATLRLLGDADENEPISVERRFGLAQYQPEAPVHARGHKWRVVGLDMASPWNPRAEMPGWFYVICGTCALRFGAQEHPRCPRCGETPGGRELAGYEFGGFLAVRNDTPVLEEEDRYGMANLLQAHPQRDGRVLGRFVLGTGYRGELRREETIRWVNEGKPPTAEDREHGLLLHDEGRGFALCPGCGRILKPVLEDEPKAGSRRGRGQPRRKAERAGEPDRFGHGAGCARAGTQPHALALVTRTQAVTLRVLVDLPADMEEEAYQTWGQSLGASLRIGMRHLYMLDGPEIEFVLEPTWVIGDQDGRRREGCLTFMDPAVGGSGFLERAAAELDRVAARALVHLRHDRCETACYRCLKSYTNQRVHEFLSWPAIIADLEGLAHTAPQAAAPSAAETHDPRPWLDAYAAGVGSPLEHAFLRLFERHGLAVERQVAVAAEPGSRPISTADFQVRGSRVLVYVDGAAFHRGERRRRDRFIRERLRGGGLGWVVEELGAEALGQGAALVDRLRQLAIAHPIGGLAQGAAP